MRTAYRGEHLPRGLWRLQLSQAVKITGNPDVWGRFVHLGVSGGTVTFAWMDQSGRLVNFYAPTAQGSSAVDYIWPEGADLQMTNGATGVRDVYVAVEGHWPIMEEIRDLLAGILAKL